MTKRFENKVVVITGGSDGIALTTAKLFASESALVYITGRRQEALDKAVAEIGNGAIGAQGNVADRADVVRLHGRIKADHGRVDVVFANAGIYEVVGNEDIDEDQSGWSPPPQLTAPLFSCSSLRFPSRVVTKSSTQQSTWSWKLTSSPRPPLSCSWAPSTAMR